MPACNINKCIGVIVWPNKPTSHVITVGVGQHSNQTSAKPWAIKVKPTN